MSVKKKKEAQVYNLKKEQHRAAAIFVTPLLITLILLFVLPVILVLIMSFTNWSMTSTTRSYVGFRNFIFVLKDPDSGRHSRTRHTILR